MLSPGETDCTDLKTHMSPASVLQVVCLLLLPKSSPQHLLQQACYLSCSAVPLIAAVMLICHPAAVVCFCCSTPILDRHLCKSMPM